MIRVRVPRQWTLDTLAWKKLGAARLPASLSIEPPLLYIPPGKAPIHNPFSFFSSFRVVFVDSDVLALRQRACSSRRDNGAKVQGWRRGGGLLGEVDLMGTHRRGILCLFGRPDHRSFSALRKNRPE